MPTRVRQQGRTGQPQAAVRVNWADPLTRGLEFFYTNGVDLVTGNVARAGAGTVSRVVSPQGYGVKGNAADNYLSIPRGRLSSGKSGSFLYVYAGNTTTTQEDAGIVAGAGDWLRFGGVDSSGGDRTFFKGARWGWNAGDSQRSDVNAQAGAVNNTVSCLYSLNGRPRGSFYIGDYGTIEGHDLSIGSSAITTAPPGAGLIALAFWNRLLTQEELNLLTLPGWYWRLATPRRLLVPVSAGGGIPTLSAATVFAITANSAQPRVTVTF